MIWNEMKVVAFCKQEVQVFMDNPGLFMYPWMILKKKGCLRLYRCSLQRVGARPRRFKPEFIIFFYSMGMNGSAIHLRRELQVHNTWPPETNTTKHRNAATKSSSLITALPSKNIQLPIILEYIINKTSH